MTVIGFTVFFHSPFRVGAAYARDGVDAAVDLSTPLPGDHLKGLMRAAARDVLGLDGGRLAEVFGGVGAARQGPCAWSWRAAQPVGDWRFDLRHRVKIDPETGSAVKDHLVAGQHAFVDQARFEVHRTGCVAASRLEWHRLVLRAAGAGVHGLGSWRRRGLGWVGIEPDEPLTDAELHDLAAARPVPAEVRR